MNRLIDLFSVLIGFHLPNKHTKIVHPIRTV